MLSVEQLREEFYPVVELGDGLIRCADELPNSTFYTYFLIGHPTIPILVSQGRTDDNFARQVFASAGTEAVTQLQITLLPDNKYGLTHLLLAPHGYHRELCGRLDEVRPLTTLCVPIHRPEFSGNEGPEHFQALRRNVVATMDWARDAAPKISLRFNNTRTGGGTVGSGYVLVTFRELIREVENLAGDLGGFVEIINFRGDVAELLSIDDDFYSIILDREDACGKRVHRFEVTDFIVSFLYGR